MSELADALRVALADSYAFSLKAQNYHWNVTGISFAEHHKFFGKLYSEVQDGVDGIAESIRTLDEFSPGSFTRFKELTTIEDELKIPAVEKMLSNLAADNVKVLATLHKAYMLAEKQMKHGISNYIQDRITAHEKHGWMLRSFTKA
jgi:starvation-inducible DNA-binding protein